MNRPAGFLRNPVTATRQRCAGIAGQSERSILLGTILLLSVVSVAMGYVLAQCFSVDMLSTFLGPPEDCWLDWHMSIGRHCFSDYSMVVSAGLQPDPYSYEVSLPIGNYQPLAIGGPAAAMLPHLLFGLPAHWLGMPLLGLIGYLLALTIGVLSPAFWASRGARGIERVVVFVALGAAAIPAWAVIDRGNSAGFIVPVALIYLVALRRERWGLVALMVVLAAVIKPWFIVMGVVLLVTRQWRTFRRRSHARSTTSSPSGVHFRTLLACGTCRLVEHSSCSRTLSSSCRRAAKCRTDSSPVHGPRSAMSSRASSSSPC
ncbi:glycosyltransferase family 87 protein [Mycobacterium intracellulare]|uniref:glycosyltransferase family 87 protein n=1 Tax=Mycobacterium intracellulare TaxID=1767 RepID=UPI00211C491C|nr:glycosyltransferase family 87 protein [Mycobacterium intracellulare]